MEARQYRELLDIQMASSQVFHYYAKLRDHYQAMIFPEEATTLPPPPPGPKVEADSEEARVAVFSIFSALRRSTVGGLHG